MAQTTKTNQKQESTTTAPKKAVQDAAESARGIGGVTADKALATARTVQRTAVSAASTAAERAAGTAGVVWTVVKARKAVVAGAGASVATAVAGSYVLGRRAGLRQRGPLSRLTGGRL
ncbi:hypothetical protein [Streptomyces sp. NPDC006307]|uniref:hypothetical protein n=1 Tax=Streptomyces sp. NPDC006307 TaxID=3156748 RepID=UPI0033B4516C